MIGCFYLKLEEPLKKVLRKLLSLFCILRKLCHLSFEDIGADIFGKDFTLCRHEIEMNCRESLIRLLSFGCLDRKGRVIYSFAAENSRWASAGTDKVSDMF